MALTLTEIADTRFTGAHQATAHRAISYLESLFPRALDCLNESTPVTHRKWCLNDSEREAFLKNVISSTGSNPADQEPIKDAMRQTAKGFSPKRKDHMKHTKYDGHVLGRVTSKESLTRTIKSFSNNASSTPADKMVDIVLSKTALDEQKEELAPFGLCQKGRVMWVWFCENNKANPYELNLNPDNKAEDLLCRLGKNADKKEMITFTHSLPADVVVRYPTVLDAALNPLWEPGGETKPLTGGACNSSSALPEGIHDSVGADCLVTPIMPLEAWEKL